MGPFIAISGESGGKVRLGAMLGAFTELGVGDEVVLVVGVTCGLGDVSISVTSGSRHLKRRRVLRR